MEYLAYKLAIESGISMSRCTAEKIAGKHHTFFTQRFDRNGRKRIHFASAMTMTGNSEDTIRDHPASYLDIVEFISSHCTNRTQLKNGSGPELSLILLFPILNLFRAFLLNGDSYSIFPLVHHQFSDHQ